MLSTRSLIAVFAVAFPKDRRILRGPDNPVNAAGGPDRVRRPLARIRRADPADAAAAARKVEIDRWERLSLPAFPPPPGRGPGGGVEQLHPVREIVAKRL